MNQLPDKKTSLVLLHGWGMHSEIWGDFAVQLLGHYRVTLIDFPAYDNLADISMKIVAELGEEPFYILGWSLGGTIALDIVGRYPNRVQGVILLATNPHFIATENWAGMPPETFNTFAEQLQINTAKTLQRFLALQCHGLPMFLNEIKTRFSKKTAPDLAELESSLALLKNSDLRSVLEKLTCPILIILSDDDALVPISIAPKMQKLNSDLQLIILNNAGHIPFITQPENCLNAIRNFIPSPLLKVNRKLDKTKIKQSFSNASRTYDNVAELQRNVGRDLLKLFSPSELTGNIIDLGCGTGFLTQKLLAHCENLIALDLALPMLQITREKLGNTINYVCADAEKLPFLTESIDHIFSNVALQWCLPIDKTLSELHRILKTDGELIFSTFGSETLQELKSAWLKVDNFSHINEFYTQHQLKLFLEQANFSNIEIKNQRYVSRYDSVLALMHELKNLGAHNVNSQRNKNLTGKTSLKSMLAHYPLNESGEIFATFEVIYIRAFKYD